MLEQQEAVLDGLRADLQSIEVAIAADQAEWRRETAVRMRALWEELDALNDRIAAFEQQSQAARGEYLDVAREAQAARRAANQAKVKLDALERNYWWWDSYLQPAKLVDLQAARASHDALDRTARALESARARSSQAAASIRREIGKLQARQKVLLHTIEDPAQSQSPRHASLAAARDRKQQEIEAFDAVLDTERARVESNPRERLIATIKSRIPMALGILAGILLLPVAIKALFYYVLAPLASRLGPIRILPDRKSTRLNSSRAGSGRSGSCRPPGRRWPRRRPPCRRRGPPFPRPSTSRLARNCSCSRISCRAAASPRASARAGSSTRGCRSRVSPPGCSR